ncbi:MAG: alpha-glucosidase C-terminal domain-containing protein [Salinivirgaceae bacterium]|nr:alpha-glucosidase C-terminal domain-containing protein [Salinivirgaceae bacterium]
MTLKFLKLFILVVAFSFVSCSTQSKQENNETTATNNEKVYSHVDWAKNANIYEVNVRQYTKEGTFAAFQEHMPRLQQMGVDILWLMPIHPVSEKNRKGGMGSCYAVQDYQKVNPDFGSLDDLKNLVNKAHELGMHVIIDWVANHTGWDNLMIEQHPDWYTKDSLGNIMVPAGTDWTDVADLNYENQEMREYMIQSLEYWVKEANIDGYRCDVAGFVPTDFWINARKRLDALKPIFMLAEWESKDLLNAFDMIYGWDFHHRMNEIAQGKATTVSIDEYFSKVDSTYNADDYIMYFTSNHDENSWNGTVFERMGNAAEAMAVLSATIPGMPLIYSGQEAKLNKRLAFFEKDEIDWSILALEDFYSKLLHLKKENKTLWNGSEGGSLIKVSDEAENIFAFVREKEENKVVVIINLSDKEQIFKTKNQIVFGDYISLFTQTNVALNSDSSIKLKPWGYQVLSR